MLYPPVPLGNRDVDGQALDAIRDGLDGPEVAFTAYLAVQIIGRPEMYR